MIHRRKKIKPKMKTLDKVLITVGVFIFAFTLATMIIYTVKDWQFDTLITMVLGGSGVEVLSTAIITISKFKRGDTDESRDY